MSLLDPLLVDPVALLKSLFANDFHGSVDVPVDLIEHFKDPFVRILGIEALEEFNELHFVAVRDDAAFLTSERRLAGVCQSRTVRSGGLNESEIVAVRERGSTASKSCDR